MAYNLKDEGDVKEYLENLGTEYRFGCYHEKKPEVCHLLGDFFEAIKQDWQKSAKVYEVNCDTYNWGHSCYKFGNYLFVGKGSLKIDHDRATNYYDKGCSLKFPDACLHAGLMRTAETSQIESKDHKQAFNYFKSGCELNQGMCCFYVSGMYISGIENFIATDMQKAFEYSSKSCELGNMHACANISQMYLKGDGVQQNLKKGEEFKKRAHEMQDQLTKNFQTISFGEGN